MLSLGPTPNLEPCPILVFFFFIRTSLSVEKTWMGKKKIKLEFSSFFLQSISQHQEKLGKSSKS
jgi:hypothetical protein